MHEPPTGSLRRPEDRLSRSCHSVEGPVERCQSGVKSGRVLGRLSVLSLENFLHERFTGAGAAPFLHGSRVSVNPPVEDKNNESN